MRFSANPNPRLVSRLLYALAWLACCMPLAASAQYDCESALESCEATLEPFEQTRGRYFRAELFPNEVAKIPLRIDFDKMYRVVPCGSSTTGEPLIVEIYSDGGLLLYSSEKQERRAYYDFAYGTTRNFTLTARYPSGRGCAVLLVGALSKSDNPQIDNLRVLRAAP